MKQYVFFLHCRWSQLFNICFSVLQVINVFITLFILSCRYVNELNEMPCWNERRVVSTELLFYPGCNFDRHFQLVKKYSILNFKYIFRAILIPEISSGNSLYIIYGKEIFPIRYATLILGTSLVNNIFIW